MTDAHADGEQPRRIDRRKALRVAGAAALGVTLSELATGELTASAQTTGEPLLLGQDNDATATTRLVVSPPAEGAPGPEYGLDIWATDSPYGVGVSGLVWGVYSTGLVGGSFIGNNDHGAAIELYPRDGDGPPPLGDHYSGEMVVDSAGRLWLCDQSGEPGTETAPRWEQVSHRGMRFLPLPQRAVSRQALTRNQTLTVDLRTRLDGLPNEAVGVFGNLTLLDPRNSGYVTVFSGSGSRPNVSTISWNQTDGFIANAFTTPIDSLGRLRVYVSQPTTIYLDVTGYVL